jgi:hypothetical protein
LDRISLHERTALKERQGLVQQSIVQLNHYRSDDQKDELLHDWVVLHTGNRRTQIVAVRHSHLIAQMGEHFGYRQAPPERWLCWIEARQAIEKIFAVLGVLDRPHEVRHQAPPAILMLSSAALPL